MILKALTQLLAISMFEYSSTFTQIRLPSYERIQQLFFKPNSIFVGIFLLNIIVPLKYIPASFSENYLF